MPGFLFDLREALRTLHRDRAYSAAVVLTLALTLGATTAVFSIVNGVLLEPLAYRAPGRLVALREVWREFTDRFPVLPVNQQHFEYWRAHAAGFESMAQYIVLPANLAQTSGAAQVTVAHASGSLFDVLGVRASIGRALTVDDERADHPRVAVVSEMCWRERLGSDPSVIGRAIVLDGKPFAVAGVLPRGFRMPTGRTLAADIDAFVAIRPSEEQVGWVGDHNNEAIGRLRAAVTVEAARAQLDVLQAQVSDMATEQAHQPVTLSASVTPLAEQIVGGARRGLLLLLGAIAAVRLIACSNIANLSLARALARTRDAAIRSALGASRARLVSRLLVEHLALGVVGGAGGLLVARATVSAFVRSAPIGLPRASDVTLDLRVMAFAAGLSVLAGLGVAVLPAWHLAGGATGGRLRTSGLSTTDTRGAVRARRALLALQVALSVTLLVVTGLLAASFVRVLRSDPGFAPDQALVLDVVLPLNRYAEAPQRAEVSERLLAGARAVPGVRFAGLTHILPLAGEGTVNPVSVEGDRRPWTVQPTANYRFVSADLFKALSIPFRAGRTFSEGDRGRAEVPAVVSERTASRMWPNVNPIGQRFRSSANQSARPAVVVGVVAETKTSIDGQPPLMVYLPYWSQPRPRVSLVVRTAIDPLAVTSGIRRAVREADPEIAIAAARPMEEIVDAALEARRCQMWLFVAFGAMALVIATVGVYAVTACTVSRRRREMNIRVALGAVRAQAMGLLVRQALAPVLAGLAGGAAGALALGAAVASQLFEVRPRDPAVLGGVVVLVGAIALVACLAAARRGLVVDPAAALREE